MVKITACPNCGSKDIKMGSLRDGVLFGIGSWKLVCKKCGYQGAPLSFDSVKEYQQYYNQLNPDGKKINNTSEKQKEGEDNKLGKDKENMESQKTEELEEKGRWRVFVVSVIFSILLTILFIPYYFSLFEPLFALLALIGAFIGFLFFSVLIFLFIRCIIKRKES